MTYEIKNNKWTILVLILGAMTLVLPFILVNLLELSFYFDYHETMTIISASSFLSFPIWFVGLPIAIAFDEEYQRRNYYNQEPDWRGNDY